MMTFKETATSLFQCFVRRSDHNSDRNNGNSNGNVRQHQQQQQQQQLNHASSSNNSDGGNTVSSSLVATATAAAAAHTTTATATATATSLVDNSTHLEKNSISIIKHKHKHKQKDYAAIATAAEKNKLIEQRQKEYLKILGPLRMGFVEYDENDTIKYYDNENNENEDDDNGEDDDGEEDDVNNEEDDNDEDDDEDDDEDENVFETKDQEEKEEKEKVQEENNTNDYDDNVIDGKVKKDTETASAKNNDNNNNDNDNDTDSNNANAIVNNEQQQQHKHQHPHPQNSTSTSMNMSINIRQLHREYLNYATTLPATPEGSIFVRVPEDRFDLPRILITGPHDTPYANGLFYFDCSLQDYPNISPTVKFLTTGNGSVRFNPNLYNCGKVCLSLLGTWHGPGWISNSSTLLQVILSIQGLIFGTEEPYYNEPGYENLKGQKNKYALESIRYNKEIRKQTIRWGILYPLKKIVWQEERVEKRRLHKLAFKLQQKEEEQQQAKEEKEQQQQRQLREEELLQDNTTTNTDSSSSIKRKNKWSSVWSSSSVVGVGGGKKKKKNISSKLPSRRNYEYTEFTEIVMKHFILNSDHIQEQLLQWQELDPRSSTKHNCEEVRTLLKRLKELVEEREIRSRTTSSTATSSSSSSKSKRRTTTTCATTTTSSSRCEEEKGNKKKLYPLLGPTTITTDAVAPASGVSLSCAASVDAPPSGEDGTAATTKDFKTQIE